MITFFENRYMNFNKVKFVVLWVIEIGTNPMFYLLSTAEKTEYYPHRDIDKVGPRFSSKFYQ